MHPSSSQTALRLLSKFPTSFSPFPVSSKHSPWTPALLPRPFLQAVCHSQAVSLCNAHIAATSFLLQTQFLLCCALGPTTPDKLPTKLKSWHSSCPNRSVTQQSKSSEINQMHALRYTAAPRDSSITLYPQKHHVYALLQSNVASHSVPNTMTLSETFATHYSKCVQNAI